METEKKPSKTTAFLKEYLDKNFQHWDGQAESYRYWHEESKKHRIIGHFHYHWTIMSLYELPMFAFWVVCLVFAAWPRGGLPGQARNRAIFLGVAVFVILWAFTPATLFPRIFFLKDADNPAPGAFFWNWKFCDLRGKVDDKYHITYGFHVISYFVSLLTIFVVGWKWLNRGQYFRSWVDYWTVGSFLAFGYAGEKVPWVTSHIAMSMMISCAFYANDIWQRLYCAKAGEAPAPPVEADKPEKGKKSIKRKRAETVDGPGLMPTIGRYAFGGFLAISLSYAGWMTWVACFRQPGSPIERHSYASSHDDFHAANRWILRQVRQAEESALKERLAKLRKEGKRERVTYETPIAMAGTQEWPQFWLYRRFKNRTATTVPATTKAEYVWCANDVMDKVNAEKLQQGGAHWSDRYVWSRIKFRHYWTPVMMDWRALWPGGRWEAPLTDAQKAERKNWTEAQWKKWREDRQKANWLSWNRLYNALLWRNEAACGKDKGRFEWKWIGGYDVFFGRLRSAQALAPGAVEAPAVPAAAVSTAAPAGTAASSIITPASAVLGKPPAAPMNQQQLQDLLNRSIKVTYITPTPEIQGPETPASPAGEAPAAPAGEAPAAPAAGEAAPAAPAADAPAAPAAPAADAPAQAPAEVK